MLADRVCSSSAAGPRLTASRPFVPITRNVHSLRPSSRSLQTPITISAASALVPPVVSEPSSSQPVQPSALQQQVLATPAVQLAFNVIRAVTLVVEQARTAFAAALPKPDQIHVQVRDQQQVCCPGLMPSL